MNIEKTKSDLIYHPLSIKGVYSINCKKEKDPWYTKNTLVSFYYNLNYCEKPMNVYIDSIKKLCQIKQPLVFFGDKETCKLVRELRNPCFTHIIEKDIKEYELIRDYFTEFNEKNEELPFNKRKKYSILTNLKPYLLAEAAKINPFYTDDFVFIDAGIFKHKHITGKLNYKKPCFSAVKTNPNKITMLCITDILNYTHQDLLDAKECIISFIISATKDTCIEFCKVFDKFVRTCFNKNIFRTEQVIFSRMASLNPDMFYFVETGYHHLRIEEMKWEETDNNV